MRVPHLTGSLLLLITATTALRGQRVSPTFAPGSRLRLHPGRRALVGEAQAVSGDTVIPRVWSHGTWGIVPAPGGYEAVQRSIGTMDSVLVGRSPLTALEISVASRPVTPS